MSVNKLDDLRKLYKELEGKEFFTIVITEDKTKRLGYRELPNTLIGRVPVYEPKYEVVPIKFTLLNMGRFMYNTRIFETKKEAEDVMLTLPSPKVPGVELPDIALDID